MNNKHLSWYEEINNNFIIASRAYFLHKATKKTGKKKTTESSDPPEDEESDGEVELDSRGSFFVHLIDNYYSQDDAEASHAEHVEVILLSSDSDLVPVQRIRRTVRKVKQSHPLAHLDPKFSLNT